MRKYTEYNGEDISHIVGAQPHRLINRRIRRASAHHPLQSELDYKDKIHDKYSRSERRNFIQVANKMYCRPIVH